MKFGKKRGTFSSSSDAVQRMDFATLSRSFEDLAERLSEYLNGLD
ncbi:MAG: hypothetical protein WCE21_05475 [Candidatus Babeliales bacterium]